jgi:adenosylhomocysteine nucleosidase
MPDPVLFLAPMKVELRPLVKKMALTPSTIGGTEVHTGSLAGRNVIAALTGIGTTLSAELTERLLSATAISHVVVVGIAGGVDPSVQIGDVVVPSVVIAGSTDAEYTPTTVDGTQPWGRLLTSDALETGADVLARHLARQIAAVDMETAAVARVCEAKGVPWSVFRAISDTMGEGLLDDAMINLAGSDGTPKPGAAAKYLATHPGSIPKLAKLARDTKRATDAAATAAISAFR